MLLNNRYRVIQTLGSGGFGETFLAEDTQMPSKRRCVVKQLKPIQNNPQIHQLVQERFQREAAILEELGGTSSQIPSLYAYFQADGEFYLVQEWIEGDTLTRTLNHGLWNENQVHSLLVNLLPVLSYVHSKRIIHRDIKPDNIILRRQDGKPVLIDFGAVRESMATVLNSQGTPTSSIIIGTPGYMPSEQAAGRPMYGSDLYSLGVTAIYLITGKQPHELETDVQTGEIIWHPNASHISPVLKQILDKAIRYHPRERYSSASDMLYALQSTAQTIPPNVHEIVQKTVPLPPNQTPLPPATITSGSRNSIIIGSLIVGIIGASAIVFSISKFSSDQVANTKTPATADTVKAVDNSNNQNDLQSPLTTKPSSNAVLPDTGSKSNSNLPSSSYFLIDSAYAKREAANKQVEKLKAKGYQQAGIFWIPDYPNLSGKQLYAAHAGKFNTRAECVDLLRNFGLQNKDAYCTFASKEPNAPSDRFYFKQFSISATPTPTAINNDYSWLSQRPVSDADLNGKTALELDIMRNSIFARLGRRFDTPGLQSYFNKQSWYHPQYSPQEFDSLKLLSKLEMSNATYIDKYQTDNNLHYFK
ncbi:serine/threonine protein kinase [Calothrix sp. NIES-4071]|nr:serine/threonine protein kinase [Calothrix sp. NIES-4071]BAZ59091.1 serine/threonine protein kinase [Calothrix sp. NIES-4105]